MGTKANPGLYDCHGKAEPNEPLFTLLGRDPQAPFLVELWASIRERLGEDPIKVQEARDCAARMRVWHADKERRRELDDENEALFSMGDPDENG